MPAADTPAGALVEPEVDQDVDATEQVTADPAVTGRNLSRDAEPDRSVGADRERRRHDRDTVSARQLGVRGDVHRHHLTALGQQAPFELAAVGAERMGELDDDAPLRSHAELAEIDPLDMKPSHSSRTRDQPVHLAAAQRPVAAANSASTTTSSASDQPARRARRRGQRSPLSGRRRRSCSRTAAGASPRSALRRTWAARARSRRGTAGSTGGRAGARRPAGGEDREERPPARQRKATSASEPIVACKNLGARASITSDRGTDRLFVASFRIVIPDARVPSIYLTRGSCRRPYPSFAAHSS